MSEKPWHVQDGVGSVSFKTLNEAERFAKRRVRIKGVHLEIWHEDHPGRLAACVVRDAFGRTWVDVLDSTLA